MTLTLIIFKVDMYQSEIFGSGEHFYFSGGGERDRGREKLTFWRTKDKGFWYV